MAGDQKLTWKDWLPQLLAWLIAALIAYGRIDTRVSLLEAAKADHDRRIQIMEQDRDGTRQRLDAILDELKTLKRP